MSDLVPPSVRARAEAFSKDPRLMSGMQLCRALAVCEYLVSPEYMTDPIDDAAPLALWAIRGDDQ